MRIDGGLKWGFRGNTCGAGPKKRFNCLICLRYTRRIRYICLLYRHCGPKWNPGLQILLSILSTIEILLFFLLLLRSIIPFFATVCHHIPLLFRIYSQFFIDVLQLCPFLTTLPPATCIFGWLHWNCMLARKVKRPPPPPHRSCFPTVVAAATVVGIMSSYYAATLLRLRLECRPLGRGSWVAGYWQIKCLSAQILYIKK